MTRSSSSAIGVDGVIRRIRLDGYVVAAICPSVAHIEMG
jgi:hypothetical protein